MIMRPIVIVACLGLVIVINSLVPKALAIKKSSDVEQYMVEDHRNRKRNNYMLPRGRNDISRKKIQLEIDPLEPEANPEDLSAIMVDYANMIRNNVILLDNSVETRTRKRGNIKVEQYSNNQSIPDLPCSCEQYKSIMDLGEDSYPRYVETRKCSQIQLTCNPPYLCMESSYNLTILKKRESLYQETIYLPNGLKARWIAEKVPVSVGCVCTKNYMIET